MMGRGRAAPLQEHHPWSWPFMPRASDLRASLWPRPWQGQHTQLQWRSAEIVLATDYKYLVGINEWEQCSRWYPKIRFL